MNVVIIIMIITSLIHNIDDIQFIFIIYLLIYLIIIIYFQNKLYTFVIDKNSQKLKYKDNFLKILLNVYYQIIIK